jgi:hypothetical protein
MFKLVLYYGHVNNNNIINHSYGVHSHRQPFRHCRQCRQYQHSSQCQFSQHNAVNVSNTYDNIAGVYCSPLRQEKRMNNNQTKKARKVDNSNASKRNKDHTDNMEFAEPPSTKSAKTIFSDHSLKY